MGNDFAVPEGAEVKVINRTHWRTDHLKAIINRVAQAELDPVKRKRYVVEVTYNRGRGRGGYCSGWAAYHGSTAQVMVPSDMVDVIDLAHTAAHEMAHSRGMTHHQMGRYSARYKRNHGWRDFYVWAEEMPLEKKPIKRKERPAPIDRATTGLSQAQEKIEEWQRRVKRAQAKIKFWRRRVAYYTRRQTRLASQCPPQESAS